MMVPYFLRLLCLCTAAFFVVNALSGLAVASASRFVIRTAEKMRPRKAARILFFVRMFPFALGATLVLALCVPSYVGFEPETVHERIGWICLTLAVLSAMGWCYSIGRAAGAALISARCVRHWWQSARESGAPCESDVAQIATKDAAVIVEKDAPLLALTGIFRPRLVVSEGVLLALSKEQLDVAVEHENAHRGSRDNLKRLFLLLAPDPLPLLRAFSLLEQNWVRLSEWAADDEAVQGDERRALSLAAALLRVARMGGRPRVSFLHTSLLAADQDLSARVERLLQVESGDSNRLSGNSRMTTGTAFAMVLCIAVLTPWHATLVSVHRLLELFLR